MVRFISKLLSYAVIFLAAVLMYFDSLWSHIKKSVNFKALSYTVLLWTILTLFIKYYDSVVSWKVANWVFFAASFAIPIYLTYLWFDDILKRK
jgi:hypothetical protein